MLDPMRTPERFYHVSQGQLSVTRHYGGCTFNGHEYLYDPTTDTLMRADVWHRERQKTRQAREAQQALPLTPEEGK